MVQPDPYILVASLALAVVSITLWIGVEIHNAWTMWKRRKDNRNQQLK